MENSDTSLCPYNQMIFDNDVKYRLCPRHDIQNMVMIRVDAYIQIEMKLDSCNSPCTNLNSEWIKDFLNIKPHTQNLLEEKVGNMF